jgi:hypothetical protein
MGKPGAKNRGLHYAPGPQHLPFCRIHTEMSAAIKSSSYITTVKIWVRQCMPGVPALERRRQEDERFKTSLGHTIRSCLKKQTKQPNPKQSKISGKKQQCI